MPVEGWLVLLKHLHAAMHAIMFPNGERLVWLQQVWARGQNSHLHDYEPWQQEK